MGKELANAMATCLAQVSRLVGFFLAIKMKADRYCNVCAMELLGILFTDFSSVVILVQKAQEFVS